MRLLESEGIPFELKEYEVGEEHLSAAAVAAAIGASPEKIYKTLVIEGQSDPYLVAVIPGSAELDLKKLAKASGNKKCEMLPMKELLPITGYVRGGCSPIGMKRRFPTYIEELCTLEDQIIVSAGRRGLQIILSPSDLIRMTSATTADLIG